jgi:putative intracellular protease/amidase
MVVLPGGQPGTDNLKADARVLNLMQQMAQQGKYVTAICAAPSVLATAGLLDGKQATCFPGSGQSGRESTAWHQHILVPPDIELSGAVLRSELQRGQE